ncbi:MAG: glycoside hydrolase family 5 protein, partial [Mobilitalea sp.]
MKKSNFRILAYLLMLVMMVFALAGCKDKNKDTDKDATVTPVVTEAPTTAPTDAPAPTDESSDLTSLEVVELMGNGINLGNTMEAYGHKTLGVTAEVSAYETLWGMPVTTKEMIDGMKAAGFDTLRLPVAWTNMMDFENGDYTIADAYLNRVEEIVNYALDNDMYVIVNDHWDGGWWGMFGSATQETRDKAMDLYVSMWTQISERFKDYSNKLIFESANEELGFRLNDLDYAPDSGALSEDECFEMTNKINQTFVDVFRKSGGNNAERFLLIAGFGTDITKTTDNRFVMPADTAKDKLLLSVHYYDPSPYTIFQGLDNWGSSKDYKDMNETLAKMTKFTDQGYGIVIGEYGVLADENNKLKNNALPYYQNFINNCDKYGYAPMLWDTNFLFDRSKIEIIDADIAAFYLEHSYAAQSTVAKDELIWKINKEMDAALANAAAAGGVPDDKALAWIMYTSADWATTNSVGDVYDSFAKTGGIVVTEPEITGEGTYTVSVDFTGISGGFVGGTAFSALAI